MKLKNNESLVIIGAGVSGLLSAALLSKLFKKVILLEKSTFETYMKQIDARDRHAHVCVAGALEKYFKLLPDFKTHLLTNGFYIGDPGVDISWSTVTAPLPKVATGSSSGYGSYKLFWKSIYDMVASYENVEIHYNSKNIHIERAQKILSFKVNSNKQEYSYNLLLVANGSPGRDNSFLNDNKIEYQTHIFTGYCCYHSFDVKLNKPLSKEYSFISEAQPGVKDLSMLYVPRSHTEGILTVGNFGEPLNIISPSDLVNALEPWKKLIPSDFISKISSVSNQTDFRTTEIWWHRFEDKDNNIFLIGDSILRVPPYTGLGLAVAIESVESLIEHLNLISTGEKSNYNFLFRQKADEIFIRLRRYESQWGKRVALQSNNSNNKKRRFSLSKLFTRKISEFIFNEAQLNRSPVASKYLIKRFHLAQDSSVTDLVGTLLQIIIHNLYKSFGRSHEKISKPS